MAFTRLQVSYAKYVCVMYSFDCCHLIVVAAWLLPLYVVLYYSIQINNSFSILFDAEFWRFMYNAYSKQREKSIFQVHDRVVNAASKHEKYY